MSCEFFDGTDGAEINTEEQKKEEEKAAIQNKDFWTKQKDDVWRIFHS